MLVITLVHELASGFTEQVFRNIYQASRRVVYPAEFVRNEAHVLFDLPLEKAVVVPQGLLDAQFGCRDRQAARAEVCEELALGADVFLVLACGTMDQRKGIDAFVMLALAALRAPAGNRSLHFVWIGGGPDKAHTPYWYARQDIDRSGLADRIHLLGPRVRSEKYFVACDVLVVTSRMDPFPCVIHEAMACAKPVIAFADAGGAAEALSGDAGIIVPYGDIRAMADEIAQLERQPERAIAIGSRAVAAVRERYVFTDYVDKLLALADEEQGHEQCLMRPRLSVGRTAAQAVTRPRVMLACGDSADSQERRFGEFLVAGLNERGFDAEMLFTGTPARHPAPASASPMRFAQRSFRMPASERERWISLKRIVEAAAPLVLVPGSDVMTSALLPLLGEGVGVLGVLHDAQQCFLEQAARLGRYWQRAVVFEESVRSRVADVAPVLADRMHLIPRPVHGVVAPMPRVSGSPLRILCVGQQRREGSAMPFLLPLLRQLQQAGMDFVLTIVAGGAEAALLRTVAQRELAEWALQIFDQVDASQGAHLLATHEVFLLPVGAVRTGIVCSAGDGGGTRHAGGYPRPHAGCLRAGRSPGIPGGPSAATAMCTVLAGLVS